MEEEDMDAGNRGRAPWLSALSVVLFGLSLSAASFALFAIGVGETVKCAFVQGIEQERQHKATQGNTRGCRQKP